MILFSHIEKCGGTSLHEFLKSRINNYLILRPTPRHGELFSNSKLKKLSMLYPCVEGMGGHRIRLYEDYENVDLFITVLRNPIDRYYSHLSHQLERGIINSIEEFSNDPFYNNFMCKRISGRESAVDAIKILEDKKVLVNLLEIDFVKMKRVNSSNSHSAEFINKELVFERNKEDLMLYNYFKEQKSTSFYNYFKSHSTSTLSHTSQKLAQIIIQELLHLSDMNKNKSLKRGR